MRVIFFSLVIILLSFGCQDQSDHPFWHYQPERNVLKKGVVNKYYEHFIPINPNEKIRTDISYTLTKSISANSVERKQYNAGFQLTSFERFVIEDSLVKLDSFMAVYRADTSITKILIPSLQNWKANNNTFKRESAFSNWKQSVEANQTGLYDTIYLNLPCKVITSDLKLEYLFDGDTNKRKSTRKAYYAQDLGLIRLEIAEEKWRYEIELIEQMPLEEFQKRANHERKRIAYINPSHTLSNDVNFNLCGSELNIADYYNSEDDKTGYSEGKKRLIEIVNESIDPEKIPKETGMLTFRFVVNCNGEAGRFVAEGYDHTFQRMTFDPETISHFLNVFSQLRKWNPCIVRDEPRDAYFYITFKFQNGKIIHILP